MATEREHSDVDLMRHYDGELAAEEAASLADHLDSDAPARAKLRCLEQISVVVRAAVDSEVDDAFASGQRGASMWAAIERSFGVDEVIATAAEPAAPAAEVRDEAPSGLLASLSAWLQRYRSHLVTGAVAAVAAAALVWVVRPPEKTVEYVEVDATSSSADVTPVALEAQPPEVESLEVYDGSGFIITIPSEGDDESETAVIWLTPPENTLEGPI